MGPGTVVSLSPSASASNNVSSYVGRGKALAMPEPPKSNSLVSDSVQLGYYRACVAYYEGAGVAESGEVSMVSSKLSTTSGASRRRKKAQQRTRDASCPSVGFAGEGETGVKGVPSSIQSSGASFTFQQVLDAPRDKCATDAELSLYSVVRVAAGEYAVRKAEVGVALLDCLAAVSTKGTFQGGSLAQSVLGRRCDPRQLALSPGLTDRLTGSGEILAIGEKPYEDGYCYLGLVTREDEQAVAAALGSWPTFRAVLTVDASKFDVHSGSVIRRVADHTYHVSGSESVGNEGEGFRVLAGIVAKEKSLWPRGSLGSLASAMARFNQVSVPEDPLPSLDCKVGGVGKFSPTNVYRGVFPPSGQGGVIALSRLDGVYVRSQVNFVDSGTAFLSGADVCRLLALAPSLRWMVPDVHVGGFGRDLLQSCVGDTANRVLGRLYDGDGDGGRHGLSCGEKFGLVRVERKGMSVPVGVARHKASQEACVVWQVRGQLGFVTLLAALFSRVRRLEFSVASEGQWPWAADCYIGSARDTICPLADEFSLLVLCGDDAVQLSCLCDHCGQMHFPGLWFYETYGLHSAHDQMSYQYLVECERLHKLQAGKVVRSPSVVSVTSGGECGICAGSLIARPASMTCCGHVYCTKCLDTWIGMAGNCPDCRGRLAQVKLDVNQAGSISVSVVA